MGLETLVREHYKTEIGGHDGRVDFRGYMEKIEKTGYVRLLNKSTKVSLDNITVSSSYAAHARPQYDDDTALKVGYQKKYMTYANIMESDLESIAMSY